MNFNNKTILRTFSSPYSNNLWANIETIGWKKVGQKSNDGVTNMAVILNNAKANHKRVSGFIDVNTNQINHLRF